MLLFSTIQVLGNSPEIENQNTNTSRVNQEESDSLVVLWTNADREVALKMICMYTYNAKKYGWWQDIVIIVWGPSSRLLADDSELQIKFKELMDAGIIIKACKGCADQYSGVTEKLESIGIEVLYVGKEFTDYLKSSREVLVL
jgi:hypothetical protein